MVEFLEVERRSEMVVVWLWLWAGCLEEALGSRRGDEEEAVGRCLLVFLAVKKQKKEEVERSVFMGGEMERRRGGVLNYGG